MHAVLILRGHGHCLVGAEVRRLAPHDLVTVPPWTWHRHENRASEDAILYSVDDWPAMAKMGFYRTEG